MGDNQVIIDQPMGEGWFFVPSYFYDNVDQHQRFPVKRVVYASMKGTDIGLLELGVSYGELKSHGFSPLTLKAIDVDKPAIEIAHIPVWLFPNRYMRYSACETHAVAATYETDSVDRADGPWFWPRYMPNACIGIYPGSSGAPVFMKDGTAVSAVVSTALVPDSSGCVAGNPCEIVEGQPHDYPGRAYVASIAPFINALKPNGSVDLTQLDPGDGVTLEREGPWSSPAGTAANWNMRIGGNYEQIRVATGYADQVHCDDPKGYGPPQAVANQPLLNLPMPQQPGIYALCAIGKHAGSDHWQPMTQATVKIRRIEQARR